MQNQIIQAIKSKSKIELNYKGEGVRLVCPHVLYESTTGKTLMDSYQTSGYSNHPDDIPGWRPFDITEITGLKVLGQTFEVAPGYNPSSDRYSRAIAMI